jgi:hypothetical protein
MSQYDKCMCGHRRLHHARMLVKNNPTKCKKCEWLKFLASLNSSLSGVKRATGNMSHSIRTCVISIYSLRVAFVPNIKLLTINSKSGKYLSKSFMLAIYLIIYGSLL